MTEQKLSKRSPSALHRTILQAWECAFADSRITYLSGPITTGPQYVERLRAGRQSAKSASDILSENCEELRRTAARLRRERGEIVIEPASLNVADWSQKDYMLLWDRLIERHVRLMLFMPGWEFSAGCAHEFTRAVVHGVPCESVAGSPLTIVDGIALLGTACAYIEGSPRPLHNDLKHLLRQLNEAIALLEQRRRPPIKVTREPLRKDASLDLLAQSMNVAQFVSFSPAVSKPHQEFARIAGQSPNSRFPTLQAAIETLLQASAEGSVNVRSYEPSSPQSREFIYGLRSAADAVAAVERLTQEGLHTIVNETIDVSDGGVSGVLMGDVLEFAPDDTPRCVEKPGTAALSRGWGRDLLSTVYGFSIDFDVPLDSRLEFSIHPRPRGWRQSHMLAWEFALQQYIDVRPQTRWPNRFSRLVGDKTFGLLVAHHVGLPVPFTTVINRRVAPFSFGRETTSGETWIRTAPNEQVPGKFTTNRGWLDPFNLVNSEDPNGETVVSILSQHGVPQHYSGGLIVARDGSIVLEGKRGEGESFMQGLSGPEELPQQIQADVKFLYSRAHAALGIVRFEWVHDGDQAWIVQLHAGATETMGGYITSKNADRWQTFDISKGLEELRRTVSTLPSGTGLVLSGRVGLTSHFADVIRRANIPARMA